MAVRGKEGDSSECDSDYMVEEYVQPQRVRRPINDDTADLLGNFDDAKRKEILEGTFDADQSMDAQNNTASSSSENEEAEDGGDQSKEAENKDESAEGGNNQLSREQLESLLRGASKVNRHVLYVTNLNFDTTKDDLAKHFSSVGTVKSIRIPKKRRGGYAFVEMADLDSFQRGFQLHNTELQGWKIKVQISEAGKKKSANKKNIIKQKNRKLAEMRNETKTFTKSGKFYDKDLKKEKAQELMARKRWRKKPAPRPAN